MSRPEESTPAAARTNATAAAEPASAGSSAPSAGSSVPSASQAAPLLMGVRLPIRVLMGSAQLCLRDIVQLGSGSVVELNCSPDDPVQIIVNDRVIAHGEIVTVGGNYGVRITQIAAPGDLRQGQSDHELLRLSDSLR